MGLVTSDLEWPDAVDNPVLLDSTDADNLAWAATSSKHPKLKAPPACPESTSSLRPFKISPKHYFTGISLNISDIKEIKLLIYLTQLSRNSEILLRLSRLEVYLKSTNLGF